MHTFLPLTVLTGVNTLVVYSLLNAHHADGVYKVPCLVCVLALWSSTSYRQTNYPKAEEDVSVQFIDLAALGPFWGCHARSFMVGGCCILLCVLLD